VAVKGRRMELVKVCLQEASGQQVGQGHDHIFQSGIAASLSNLRRGPLALGGPF